MASGSESILYTTISDGLAIRRYGASPLLRCSKCWTLDGWLADHGDPNSLCGAYSLQDLLSARTDRKIEIEVTGNSRYDLTMAMSRLLSEMKSKNFMPFRVWMFDHYASGGGRSTIQFVCDQSGRLRTFRFDGRRYEEAEVPQGVEVERSTGYDDAHGVPVFHNDAASMDGGLFKVSLINGSWQLIPIDGDESAGVDLASSRSRLSVVSSSRTDWSMIRKIAGLMAAQEKFAVAAWR